MAPSRQAQATFSKDERILCFHMEMLYEAKILDINDEGPAGARQYKVHYKGWKNTWDDWVPIDRILKFTDENRALAQQLQQAAKQQQQQQQLQQQQLQQQQQQQQQGRAGGGAGGAGGASAPASGVRAGMKRSLAEMTRGSEERGGSGIGLGPAPATGGRGSKRSRDTETETEDAFHNRPIVRLPLSDFMKGLLVDDWENITRLNQLVPIPHPKPVTLILSDYLVFEKQRRKAGSASMDILEETINGIRQYFDKALGRILLYRFERPQWHEILLKIREADETSAIKGASDAYGAEHLSRLLSSLGELVAQTNMDTQSVSRLREELSRFIAWFSSRATHYFVKQYETPSPGYIEKARTF